MKKRLFLSIPLLCLVALPICLSQEAIKTDASTQVHLVVDDNFNNGTFKGTTDSSKWYDYSNKTIGQSLSGETYMYNHTSFSGVEHVDFSTKFDLENLEYFQFDFKYDADSVDSTRWFSLFFLDDPDSLVIDKLNDNYLAYNGCGRFTKTNVQPGGTSDFASLEYLTTAGITALDDWITIKVEIIDNTHGKFFATRQGEEFSDNGSTFTYARDYCTLNDPYVMIGLSHDAGGIMFDNIKASYNGGTIIEEDFDDFDVETDINFQLCYFNNADPDKCTIDFVCNSKLEFTNASNGAYITTKNSIEDDAKDITDITLFEASFDLSLVGNDTISLIFGLQEDQDDLYKETVVYEMNASKGILKEFDEEGNQTTTDKTNTHTFGKAKDGGSTITMTYTVADGITIAENGTKVKNSGAKVNFEHVSNIFGRVGIVLKTKDQGESTVDNIRITNNYYYIPTTKSVTHNFSNDFFGNEGYEDFYVHDPSGAGIQSVKDGRLVWSMASDTTFFGSAHQYDNFILDFKLMTIKADPSSKDTKDYTACDKWIGLDMSRSTVDYPEYGSYLTLITNITQAPESTHPATVAMWNQSYSPIDKNSISMKNFATVDPDLFRAIQYKEDTDKSSISEDDAVCFRYVSQDGTLSFYLKKNCEKTFTKYWEYYDLELNGYFTLCCTGWTYLELDDFSMSNTSDVYVCADNECPETITEVVTNTVYDNQNAKVDFDEEIKINTKSGCGGSIIASSAVAAIIGLIGVIGVVIKRKQ